VKGVHQPAYEEPGKPRPPTVPHPFSLATDERHQQHAERIAAVAVAAGSSVAARGGSEHEYAPVGRLSHDLGHGSRSAAGHAATGIRSPAGSSVASGASAARMRGYGPEGQPASAIGAPVRDGARADGRAAQPVPSGHPPGSAMHSSSDRRASGVGARAAGTAARGSAPAALSGGVRPAAAGAKPPVDGASRGPAAQPPRMSKREMISQLLDI